MRTQVLCLAVIGVGAALLLSGGEDATAAISGSDHDFSGKGWNSGSEICQPCHTPHNADVSVLKSPLWNHDVTTATFTLYQSDTLDASVGQPSGVSKLCLSCHDGTVALDSFGGSTGTNFIGGGDKIGTDLNKHHPIGFVYDATLATTDGELFDPTTTNSGLGGTITADLLIGDQLECASCHDVHNGPDAVTVANKLLVIDNAASKLCLTCHNK